MPAQGVLSKLVIRTEGAICMTSSDTERPLYEPPTLTVLGSLHELTQSGSEWPCLWKKTIGPPDYVNWIPIANCSS